MALLPRSADYTSRDFDSIRARLRNLIRSVMPTWTDEAVANFGNILVELFSWVGDVLAYYQDAQAAESRITTATQRRNLLALAKLIGYTPPGASAATALVTFSASPPPQGPVTIPAGTVVKTRSSPDPVEFQLLAPVVLTPSAATAVGLVEQSRSRTEVFASNGLPNQEIGLSGAPYLDNSAVVSAANGTYTQAPSFLASKPGDRHFTVTIDDSDRARVRFGNGVSGQIPSGDIAVLYKVGGGAAGRVEAGTITVLDTNLTDNQGRPVTVAVTNPAASSGGEDRQSKEQIRILAPASLRVLGRTVSREDYEINARLVPGVARALMLTRNEDPTIGENLGFLYVVPTSLDIPTGPDADPASFLGKVHTQVTVTFPNTVTFVVNVVPPVYLDIGVSARIFLRPGADPAGVKADCLAALTNYFATNLPDGTPNSSVDFGFNLRSALPGSPPAGQLPLSDLFNAVRDVQGVRSIGDGLNDFRLSAVRSFSDGSSQVVQALGHADVPIQIRDFPRLARSGGQPDVTLVNGDTGLSL